MGQKLNELYGMLKVVEFAFPDLHNAASTFAAGCPLLAHTTHGLLLSRHGSLLTRHGSLLIRHGPLPGYIF
ncbi:hypothetical protein Tco_1157054 [Tanacetum coccineum]